MRFNAILWGDFPVFLAKFEKEIFFYSSKFENRHSLLADIN